MTPQVPKDVLGTPVAVFMIGLLAKMFVHKVDSRLIATGPLMTFVVAIVELRSAKGQKVTKFYFC